MMLKMVNRCGIGLIVVAAMAGFTFAQTTVFSYQGILNVSGTPANGNYDFEFKLFDAASGGTQQGASVQRLNVAVANGVYAVSLDFGAGGLTGADRYLDIAVRTAGGGAFTSLSPRQRLTSSPYSIRSLSAATAENLTAAGSGNYIQNTTTQQGSSNFNISGNGIIGGSVGIGTSAPQTKVQIRDNNGQMLVGGGGCGLGIVAIGFGPSLTCTNYSLLGDGASTVINRPAGNAIFFRENNADQMFIKTGGNVGIGTTNPITKLHVFGNGGLRVTADSDANAGFGLMLNNQPKWSVATTTPGQFQIFNDALGQNAVWIDPTTNNVGIGVTDPNTYRLDVSSSSGGLRVASSHPGIAIAEFVSDGAILFGRPGNTPGDKFRIIDRQNGPIINRGIVEINNPQATLTSADTKLIVNGYIRINAPALGVGLPVCQEPVTQNLVLCAVSSRRYKKNIQDFNGGLDMISRLRPVTFDWKRNDQHDFGLVAEEVEEVNPLLVHYDADGQVLGIKYDHIGVIAINAIKEQQAQIEAQQKLIADQQRQIDELKKLVCLTNRTAGLCREEK